MFMLFVLCVVSFEIGVFVGEGGSSHRRYQAEKELIEPVLDSNSAFTELEIRYCSSGGAYLEGLLSNQDDYDVLEQELRTIFGNSRLDESYSSLGICLLWEVDIQEQDAIESTEQVSNGDGIQP